MDNIDLNGLSEQEILTMYSDIIESGQQILIAKQCFYTCPAGTKHVAANACCNDTGYYCTSVIYTCI